jgi:hypothetical protein
MTEYQRQWAEKNKERLREYRQEYYKKNKERCDGHKAKWLANNPDKRKAILEKNAIKKKANLESSPEAFFGKVLRRIEDKHKRCHKAAKEKYQQFDLTVEYLVQLWENQEGKCALSNKKMEHKFNSLFTVSVDRIDSSVGYLQGNIQLVCQAINYAKNCYSNEQFLHFWNSNKE